MMEKPDDCDGEIVDGRPLTDICEDCGFTFAEHGCSDWDGTSYRLDCPVPSEQGNEGTRSPCRG